jgi:hypothetical protein
MPVDAQQAMFESATEVLETMFFTSLAGVAAPAWNEANCLDASLTFGGGRAGAFGVHAPLAVARRIAANFLGADEDALTPEQIGQVLCELTNMLCGSTLCRLAKDTLVDLASPMLSAAPPHDARVATRTLELEEGPLAVWLRFDEVL